MTNKNNYACMALQVLFLISSIIIIFFIILSLIFRYINFNIFIFINRLLFFKSFAYSNILIILIIILPLVRDIIFFIFSFVEKQYKNCWIVLINFIVLILAMCFSFSSNIYLFKSFFRR